MVLHKTLRKMHNTNFLLFLVYMIIQSVRCEVEADLNLNQIGTFVHATQQAFFIEVARNEKLESQNEQLTKKLAEKLEEIGEKYAVNALIEELKKRVKNVRHYVAKKSNEICENFSEKRCREKERETMARLIVRELFNIGRKIVKYKILKHFFQPTEIVLTLPLHLMANAVKFALELSNITYYGVHENLEKLIKQIDEDLAEFEEAIDWLVEVPFNITIKTHTTDEELREFNPINDLPQDRVIALVTKPRSTEVPVYVFTEKFHIRLKIGALGEAIGISHRGVKVYDIEFQYGNDEGVLVSDRMRMRSDPERGVKFSFVGFTRKSRSEVQKIYDELNDFYIENGKFEEGKFGMFKYDLLRNNCIHFSKTFAEKLLGIESGLKVKNWPPDVLKQPAINGNACRFMAQCLSIRPVVTERKKRKKAHNDP